MIISENLAKVGNPVEKVKSWVLVIRNLLLPLQGMNDSEQSELENGIELLE